MKKALLTLSFLAMVVVFAIAGNNGNSEDKNK
jgi:hypothetical protein